MPNFEQRPSPSAMPSRPPAIPSLRTRLDALAAVAIEAIEREGLYVDGEPHALIPALGILLAAGMEHRQVAVARRSLAIDIALEQRPHA